MHSCMPPSQARAQLFQSLARRSQGASATQLAEVLAPLCDCAMLLPDTAEGQLLPHAQHYRQEGKGRTC